MTGNTNRTIPLTVTVPENHEDSAILDVIDPYASVHATYVERTYIHHLPDTWRNACGFYILFSPIKEDGSYTVYVGKSDKDFTKRMRSHDEKKQGWNVALLVQRKSIEGLSSTQSSYLEGALRDMFVRAAHVGCQNIARTGDWTLPEHEKIIMKQVVDSTLRIMLLRGYRTTLLPRPSNVASNTSFDSPSRETSAITPPIPPRLTGFSPSAAPVTAEEVTVLAEGKPLATPQATPVKVTAPVEPARKSMFSLFGKKKAETQPPRPEEVYAALLEWRKEQSRVLRTKYRFILEDYTLKALSEKMPATYDDLLQIPGIKEKKREQFGESILQVLAQFKR